MVWPQKGKGEPEKVPGKALRKAEGNRVQRLRETWEAWGSWVASGCGTHRVSLGTSFVNMDQEE